MLHKLTVGGTSIISTRAIKPFAFEQTGKPAQRIFGSVPDAAAAHTKSAPVSRPAGAPDTSNNRATPFSAKPPDVNAPLPTIGTPNPPATDAKLTADQHAEV